MQAKKITPFLWFNNNAEEAMKFYVSIFENSKIISTNPFGGTFIIEGQEVQVLNGGPHFKLNEAFSFFVRCETQEEIDEKWAKLTAEGGEESMCGWLKDKFGVSWQIIPPVLGDMLADKDPVKSKNVLDAMMKMKKINIAKLKEAYNG